jgi:hypothetical protein
MIPVLKEHQLVAKLEVGIITYLGNRILVTLTDGRQAIFNNRRGDVAVAMSMSMFWVLIQLNRSHNKMKDIPWRNSALMILRPRPMHPTIITISGSSMPIPRLAMYVPQRKAKTHVAGR